MGEPEGLVKVSEWQQTYYAGDSGIQSGATTVRDDEGTEYSTSKHYTVTTVTAAHPAGNTHTHSNMDSLWGHTHVTHASVSPWYHWPHTHTHIEVIKQLFIEPRLEDQYERYEAQ